MRPRNLLVLPIFLACFFGSSLESASASSSRSAHRFGIHVGFLGDPFPTLIGGNLNLNVFDFTRLTAGFGTVSAGTLSATTIGGGLRLFVPGWNFSPVLGVSYANVTVSGLSGTGEAVGGFTGSGGHVYTTFGFDWQADIGFNLGFGYNYSLAGAGGLPYLNIGWYF